MGASLSGPRNADCYRQCLIQGRVPQEGSITHTGVMNEYFYLLSPCPSTGELRTEKDLEVTAACGVSQHWESGQEELWLALGLHCKEDGLNERRPLQVVIVVDRSGSMGTSMDQSFPDPMASDKPTPKTKMQVANDVVAQILRKLNPDESVGVVLYDDLLEVVQQLAPVREIEIEKLCEKVGKVKERGGTDMELGFEEAVRQLEAVPASRDFERRVLFLTDAMPNCGGGKAALVDISATASKQGIHSTFIGVGLDFNADLVDAITKVRGGNYFSVHSEEQFHQILVDEFNYIVTPLVHDVEVCLDDPGFQIEEVFGSPDADKATGTVVKLTTVCGSAVDPRGVKGGLILLRLKRTAEEGWQGCLRLKYRNHAREIVQEEQSVDLLERFN
eukprot:CAMPEP_0204456954 /NCGR_PEP_ID=MMETSP0471-20130131/2496_1 /ASSEMBLY_ACC=CAM_ASM_000602 /TAXON_ID=2969 /ORGANISM="Oxyrrhis marina" /LENGTH=388 /DNA_ID=CAMNT_0051457335 /DNA_START=25 /DNA_END=1188 /DNA_ORIENTATION=-